MNERRDWTGNHTWETVVAFLNLVARAEELAGSCYAIYPLSAVAADLGRSNLVSVQLLTSGMWGVLMKEPGWRFVTDPEARTSKNRRDAMARLRG